MEHPVCWLIRRRLDAFQDGELGSAARARTAAHLARCPRCATELSALGRLRAALTSPAPEPSEAVWEAFWPQVRAQIAAAPVEAAAARWRPSAGTWGPWRLAIGSAVAAALAVVLIVAPWQRGPERPDASGIARSGSPATPVVVESVETADPQSSVMIFTNPESQVTVVWVFGLEPTGPDI